MSYPSGCYKNTNNSSNGKFTRNTLIGSLNLDLNSTWWMLRTRRRIARTGFGFLRVNYYANSTASFQHAKLLLSGDVAVNPGLQKCHTCDRTMARNHRVMTCTECKRRTHITCSQVSLKEYAQLQQKPSYTTYCTNCLFSFLPGYDDEASTEDVNIININLDLQVLRHDIIDYRKDNHHDLMIAHLNINSLQNKLDNLKLLNRELKSQVIFLSETKIDSSYKDDQFSMRGYNTFRKDRKKGGGGLMAFISMNIASKKVSAPAYRHVEVLAIEIKTTCSTILLVRVYRPPKAVGNAYFSKLEDELSSLCMWAELQKQLLQLLP